MTLTMAKRDDIIIYGPYRAFHFGMMMKRNGISLFRM